MGELQLEVYCERIRREYECNLLVGKPEVAYREAIRQPVHFDFTYRKQTGGPGQYARLKGYLEPSETPFEFINSVVGGSVPESFLRAAEAGFAEALQQGCLRKAPVMGVRVVIQDGATHPVDSSERSFQAAARQIVRDSLPQAAAVLMEPLLKASLELPSESLGAVLGHLARKRAIVQNSQTEGDSTHVEAEVPAADMFGYMSELRSLTRGSGTCTLEPSRYAMVH
jgi:elongation factor G